MPTLSIHLFGDFHTSFIHSFPLSFIPSFHILAITYHCDWQRHRSSSCQLILFPPPHSLKLKAQFQLRAWPPLPSRTQRHDQPHHYFALRFAYHSQCQDNRITNTFCLHFHQWDSIPPQGTPCRDTWGAMPSAASDLSRQSNGGWQTAIWVLYVLLPQLQLWMPVLFYCLPHFRQWNAAKLPHPFVNSDYSVFTPTRHQLICVANLQRTLFTNHQFIFCPQFCYLLYLLWTIYKHILISCCCGWLCFYNSLGRWAYDPPCYKACRCTI